MLDRLQYVKQRFDEVSDLIIQPDVIADQKRYVQLNKEYKDLKALVDKREEYINLDGNIKVFEKSELNYNYRTTDIKENKWIVVEVYFKFSKGFDKECSQDKKDKREQRHPLELPNLGSTFKNPDQNFAAQLISDAGLKEYRVGNAMISPKHPNFIVNLGEAGFEDVMGVIEHVKEIIKEKNNIDLQTEIIIVK